MSAETGVSISRRDLLKGGLLLGGAILLDGCGIQLGDTTTRTLVSEEGRLRPLTEQEIRFENAVADEIEHAGFEHAYSTSYGPFDLRVFGEREEISPADVKDTLKIVSSLQFGKRNSEQTQKYVAAFDATSRKVQEGTLGPQVINLILEPSGSTCVEFNDDPNGSLFVRKKLKDGGCLGDAGGFGLPDYGMSANFEDDGFKNIALIIVRHKGNPYETASLSPIQQERSTLAHELAHIFIGLGLDAPRKTFSLDEEAVADAIQKAATDSFTGHGSAK